MTCSTGDRRRFLQVMGASVALAATGGVPLAEAEEILPFASGPTGACPATTRFATALDARRRSPLGPAGHQLRRPADQDRGQPPPPATPARRPRVAQAAMLELYDPDRSRTVVLRQRGAELRRHVGGVRRAGRRHVRGARRGRDGARRPGRGHHLADVGGAAPRLPRRFRRRAGSSGAGRRTTTSGRARAWRSGGRCGRTCARTARTVIVVPRRRSARGASRRALRPRARASPPAARSRGRRDEPALRRRERD